MDSLQPLGDRAALASCRDERAALRLAAVVRRLAPPWLIDVVQAYTTVAFHFDLDQVRFADVAAELRRLEPGEGAEGDPGQGQRRLRILPCCYEMQQDLERVARHVGLALAEVVRLHAATEYTVYAVGFSPGFPYLGYLPDRLCGVPRLEAPRVRVEAGSVGLTGRQNRRLPGGAAGRLEPDWKDALTARRCGRRLFPPAHRRPRPLRADRRGRVPTTAGGAVVNRRVGRLVQYSRRIARFATRNAMPEFVACSACGCRVQMADSWMGRTVRCIST